MRHEPSVWFHKTFRCLHAATKLETDDNGDRRLVCKECGRTVMHRRAGAFKP